MRKEVLKQNKESWNTVAHHFNGVDALPSYGPFAQTEDELHLFGELTNKKVLEIGYGSGHSLRYMANRGASELWGVDLSLKQKNTAEQTLADLTAHLYCAPMEEEIGLPVAYFDVVYSIFAIGWTTDLEATFKLIYQYVKKGGCFIFSWDHPLYVHLKSNNGQITLDGSYQEEGPHTFLNFKGEQATMEIQKRKMSTYINELIKVGFTIQEVIESDVSEVDKEGKAPISDRYYSLYKARKFPTTMIIKAIK
ncbi:class I SAM-dependent methyltransferase [Guptibacillus hwajinpoensis]|uniref:Ubiquinone/menaquinone biosynthesis C-methylase UbiE n=1 Tax=Guptibacillus hwajinpoensis TaxID=208199 RepID=A0ABU0K2P5_9BACL|nr:class I SAM-dependent methyltransferase [Alkalihalobacillus hemicentroti]MDQ0483630.1 ubiquinone/menaquinone biosynthesis C-methylase UbiE [Alkalihalobacillus hemicentroti]